MHDWYSSEWYEEASYFKEEMGKIFGFWEASEKEQFIELLQQMNKILIALLPKLGKAFKGR